MEEYKRRKREAMRVYLIAIVIVNIVAISAFVIASQNKNNDSLLTSISSYELPNDIEFYEEVSYKTDKNDYYKDVMTQHEFYENMPDNYTINSDPSLDDVSYYVFIGEWVDEGIRKATILLYKGDTFSYNTKYLELYTKGTYSYEDFEAITNGVLLKYLEGGN